MEKQTFTPEQRAELFTLAKEQARERLNETRDNIEGDPIFSAFTRKEGEGDLFDREAERVAARIYWDKAEAAGHEKALQAIATEISLGVLRIVTEACKRSLL